eukprot:gene16870-biopygen20324
MTPLPKCDALGAAAAEGVTKADMDRTQAARWILNKWTRTARAAVPAVPFFHSRTRGWSECPPVPLGTRFRAAMRTAARARPGRAADTGGRGA